MREDLTFDLHYGYWFNLLCERFYRHVGFVLNFVQLVGGSGAALSAISANSFLVVVFGIILAACAAVSLLIDPGAAAEKHRAAKDRFLGIKSRLAQLDDDALNAEVVQAQREGPAGIGSLAVPAFNATLDALGRTEGHRPLNGFGRMAMLVT